MSPDFSDSLHNPTEFNHFRAINKLCVFSKILDLCIYEKLSDFVHDGRVIDQFQAGFQAGNSTETALIRMLDDVRHGSDNRKFTILCLIDFSRAFDSLNHELIACILRSVNLSKNLVCWFSSLLNNRKQMIKTIDGKSSKWCTNKVGTPQGSVISALIFIL